MPNSEFADFARAWGGRVPPSVTAEAPRIPVLFPGETISLEAGEVSAAVIAAYERGYEDAFYGRPPAMAQPPSDDDKDKKKGDEDDADDDEDDENADSDNNGNAQGAAGPGDPNIPHLPAPGVPPHGHARPLMSTDEELRHGLFWGGVSGDGE